jgi:hypothetical protein
MTRGEAALIELLLPIARRRKRERVEALLDEVDRLGSLDGMPLLRMEKLTLTKGDTAFATAVRVAELLLPNVDAKTVELVQLTPEDKMPAFELYAVFGRDTPRYAGAKKRVADQDLADAWRRAEREVAARFLATGMQLSYLGTVTPYHLLLVDEDDQVRVATQVSLEALGHRVCAISDVDDVETHVYRCLIHWVIFNWRHTSHVVGRAQIEHVVTKAPEARVLVLTELPVVLVKPELPTGVLLLGKPYFLTVLDQVIRSVPAF